MGRSRFDGHVMLLIFVFFVVVTLASGILTYTMSAGALKVQMGQKCAALAQTVAVVVGENIEDYNEFTRTLDMGTEYYGKTKAEFMAMAAANKGNVRYIYTETRADDDHIKYILGGEPASSPNYTAPGTLDKMTEPRRRAYESKQLYIGEDFIATEWGTLLSAYAPIYSGGTFAGLVGVDVDIESYREIMRPQVLSTGIALAVMTLMMGLVMFLTSERVVRAVNTDELTTLYTKGYFKNALRREIRAAAKDRREVFVLMADLDHFKAVNDTYGHMFGDKVLKAAADALASCVRRTDCLARYGGEEFVAFLSGVTAAHMWHIMSRMRAEMVKRAVETDDGEKVVVTISIGATKMTGNSVSAAIEDADRAMYQAKTKRDACALSINGVVTVDS
ncbi:hypothetical protein FACS1894217_01000 [Clostridia bacterium]|nr:hypothetical protein FACS1894217_01000 [Clostridia bacterium]